MNDIIRLADEMGNPPCPAPDPPSQLPGYDKKQPSLKDEKQISIPKLEDIDYPTLNEDDKTPFKGGESVALQRLAKYISKKDWIAKFEKPKGNPAQFKEPATTVLSPYIKFGCLSVRLFHQKICEVYRQKKGHSQPPASLRGQLLFRELFYTCGEFTPNFWQMEENPICRQIDWDQNDKFLHAWEFSETGYPWIDAIMTQLRKWGWMHHLARHSVACFLTRGDLYQSWEKGRNVFERYLIDADFYINNANWMWLSCSAFFYQFGRVYSPVTFGKKYDKEGEFIRYFLPVLKDMPKQYIYEPWKAPMDVQKKANCIIGKDYPQPIVEHADAKQSCLDRIAAAYQRNREGVTQEKKSSPKKKDNGVKGDKRKSETESEGKTGNKGKGAKKAKN